jgi:hypothetical protein
MINVSAIPARRVHRDEASTLSLTWRDWRPVLFAALLALMVGGGLIAAFGGVSPYARPDVLANLSSTVYWLAASTIGACSTIAALMLTTVGLMEHLDTQRLTGRFLFRLHLVVRSALATIALAVFALVLTVFPASGTNEINPTSWQVNFVYWTLLADTALMIGGFATVLGALSTTINEVFRTLPQEWVEDILTPEESADSQMTGESRSTTTAA